MHERVNCLQVDELRPMPALTDSPCGWSSNVIMITAISLLVLNGRIMRVCGTDLEYTR